MRALYVPLTKEARDRLTEAAQRERRAPRDQAAWILERELLADERRTNRTAKPSRSEPDR